MTAGECRLLVCNCNRTMAVDGKALGRALGLAAPLPVATALCRQQLGVFEAGVRSGDDLLVGCTQEAPLFSELHDSLEGRGVVRFVNLRETAGWSREGAKATPKMAALIAAARLPEPEPAPGVSYDSQRGRLLLIGPAGAALAWAKQLATRFEVSVLVTAADGTPLPDERRYAVFSGVVEAVRGHLGAFEVAWRQHNPIDLEACTRCGACVRACPEQAIDATLQVDASRCRSHRACVTACGAVGAIDFTRSDAARGDTFDLVLDLGAEPVLRMPQLPQGYLAPGRDPLEQALAVTRLADLVGEFEKPRFVAYREKLCAHGRSGIVGCSRCLDVCSTAAISPDGDRVRVDPHRCMGCGGCATVCPSGALSYLTPGVADQGRRLRTLLSTWRDAGGGPVRLLFHDAEGGREAVARLARRGGGLPADVVPVEVLHVASVGLDLALGAVAWGAGGVMVLATEATQPEYVAALQHQFGVGNAALAGLGLAAIRLSVAAADAEGVIDGAAFAVPAAPGMPPATFHLGGDKRGSLGFVFEHLHRHAPAPVDVVPLPGGAPYGTVTVDAAACTLCMACTGACPEGALVSGRDSPALRFIEKNCVQCGLCATTCPERAITLEPRLLLTAEAGQERTLNEAPPYECIACGKPFATRRMIEGMLGRLAGHSMFTAEGALERLKMCADCRVRDLMQNARHGSILDP